MSREQYIAATPNQAYTEAHETGVIGPSRLEIDTQTQHRPSWIIDTLRRFQKPISTAVLGTVTIPAALGFVSGEGNGNQDRIPNGPSMSTPNAARQIDDISRNP